jgi:hypothetical protein
MMTPVSHSARLSQRKPASSIAPLSPPACFSFTPSPLSRKPPALLNLPLVRKLGIPVIKRFSGGGTVVVDDDTLFATLLMRQDDLPDVRPYPRDIMSFMETFYQDVFTDVGSEGFRLKENGEPVCQKHCRPGSFSADESGRHI